MRYLLFISIIFFANKNVLQGQNLVPNPSFEDTISCPTFTNQIFLANGWSAYRESPDYFNSCNVMELGVPNNARGNQLAIDGVAYAGLSSFHPAIADIREYLGIQLNQPLISGQLYYVSLYISLADTFGQDCAVNNFGIKFSNSPYSFNNPAPITNSADIFFSTIIDDKINWTKLSGTFIPNQSFQYLIIGNFFDDLNTDTANCSFWNTYYVDMVCVSSDSIDCELPTSSNSEFVDTLNEIELFPIPTRDNITIKSKHIIKSVTVYNVNGAKVKTFDRINEFYYLFDTSTIKYGVYFVNIITRDSNTYHKIVNLNN